MTSPGRAAVLLSIGVALVATGGSALYLGSTDRDDAVHWLLLGATALIVGALWIAGSSRSASIEALDDASRETGPLVLGAATVFTLIAILLGFTVPWVAGSLGLLSGAAILRVLLALLWRPRRSDGRTGSARKPCTRGNPVGCQEPPESQ